MRYKQSKQQLKVMICGPKGSGKSSFCRLLANSILTTKLDTTRKSDIYPSVDHNGTDGIAYLDLDPGQPEFSPPGEVSLVHMRACNFGVPYSHPMIVSSEGNKLIRAHHIGYLSPKDDPDHYLKCALDLYARYKLLNSQYPSCALIINTSGWIQGSGLEVLTELIRLIALTDVLYLSLSGPTEVTETLTNVTLRAGIPFQQLASPEPGISTRTASDFRIMQTMSYFHLDEPEGEFLRWNASPLTETPPLTVRYAGATQDIFAIMVLGDKLEPKNLACILEGCVVGLVAIEDDLILPREKDEVVYGNHAGLDKDQERVADPQDAAPLHLEPRKRKGSFSSSDDEPGPTARNHFPFESKGEMALFLASPTHHEEIRSGSEVDHASILRTPEDLPYLSPPSGAQTALNPSKSYSLGQALIRGINAATKTLHLITPIPPATFHALGRQNTKIVLVRGRLGSPTWAYREEYALAAARRRRIKKLNGAVEGFGKEEARAWAEGTPWASVDLGRAGSHGAKVWRVRRDLKGRGEEKEE